MDRIAEKACMSLGFTHYVSELTDWKNISLTTAFAFCDACGVGIDDHKAWRRIDDYLRKRPTFRYLRASTEWESTYKPLLRKWRESYPVECMNIEAPEHIRSLIIRLTPIIK